MNWKKSITKDGNKRFYKLFKKSWINAIVYKNNRIFITYNGDKISNKILYNENNETEILNEIENLINNNNDDKDFSKLRWFEQLEELGRREEKKVRNFTISP